MVVAGYMAAGQTAETAIELAAVDKAVGPVDHLAADRIEVAVSRVAVVGAAAWVADTHSAGTDPTAAQVADTPAEEAANHQSALRCFHEKPRPYQTYSYLAVQL